VEGSAPAWPCPARHSAVDHQLRARHVVGRLRGEEEHAVCDVLRCPGSPDRTPAWAISFGSSGTLRPAEPAIFVQIGVSMTPGWTVLTRTPSSAAAHSIATAFANRRTPPLVAQ